MSLTLVCVIERPRSANSGVPESVAKELEELRAENARLLRLLKLTRAEAAPPGPAQAGLFDAPPGPVHAGSPAEAKVALAAHLSGQVHIGLYPLLDGDRCWWLAADFDGPAALLDALNYVKAARAINVPAGLEVSRSGIGAHAWISLPDLSRLRRLGGWAAGCCGRRWRCAAR